MIPRFRKKTFHLWDLELQMNILESRFGAIIVGAWGMRDFVYLSP